MNTTQDRPSTVQILQNVSMMITEAKKIEKSLQPEPAMRKYQEAYMLSEEGAMLLKNDVNAEPVRSYLFMYCSILALKLQKNKEAFNHAVEGKRFCPSGTAMWGQLEDLRIKALNK